MLWSHTVRACTQVKNEPLIPGLRPAGSDHDVVCQKNSFSKVSVSLSGFGPFVAPGKILWDDVVFKLRKTKQKFALSLTPLGAVRAAAEGTGYKNRRLGKSRGVRFDWRPVSRLYGTIRIRSESDCRSVFLLTLRVSLALETLLFLFLWVQWILLWRQRRILSHLCLSPLPLRVDLSIKVARNEVENTSFAQRSAHRDSRIWRPELIEPAARRKRRARGRRPTFKSAYPDPQILPQCNISSNYPL